MTRKEFMASLSQYLAPLPISDEERTDILSDYEEHFRVGMENGKTESEIAASLGSPYDVASQYVSENNSVRVQPVQNVYRQPYTQQSQQNNYNTQQGGYRQSYSQQDNYNTQQGGYRQSYTQQDNYNAQQNSYGQSYAQQNNYNAQQGGYRQSYTQQDGYVYEEQPRQSYQSNSNNDKTVSIVIVVLLCIVLIPTVGATIVGLLGGLYASAIGFGAAGVGLIIGGAASFLLDGWIAVGLILMGVSFLALTGLLIMASIEATKLFIKLIKWCIKECKKMITEGVF